MVCISCGSRIYDDALLCDKCELEMDELSIARVSMKDVVDQLDSMVSAGRLSRKEVKTMLGDMYQFGIRVTAAVNKCAGDASLTDIANDIVGGAGYGRAT
jgi:hypothetical protein